MAKEKTCRFGHICTSGCQNDFDCPCLSDHCCEFSEDVCDRTCDNCYWKKQDLDEQMADYKKIFVPCSIAFPFVYLLAWVYLAII